MQLHKWQTEFQQVILRSAQESAQAVNPSVPLQLTQQGPTAELRLAIYHNAYRLRLTEALRSNFPALHQLLGDEDFNAAASQFLQHNPPTTASIRWFGDALPGWLSQQKPYAELPAIAELAQFEWALRHALDAANASTVTPDDLQRVPPERWADLHFTLHPSVTLLNLQWNAIAVWQALTNDQVPPDPAPAPGYWLVYRQENLMNAWRSLDPQELEGLTRITSGQSFGDLCEYLYTQREDPELAINTAASWLRSWSEQGLLAITDTE